jgi:Domain of unknown function (DUF4251)
MQLRCLLKFPQKFIRQFICIIFESVLARFLNHNYIKLCEMKTVQVLLQKTGFTIILLSLVSGLFAQDQSAASTKNIIESGHYVFNAQTVLPTSGRVRQLTSEYTLKISNDSVIADLPYFGKAYSAPADLTGGGISFTSVKPVYSVIQDKKNRWQITIKPKDVRDVENLSLTIFENGSADLNVINKDRQPISFRGYITSK